MKQSIFSKWNPERDRIKRSQEKLLLYPEIRGLLQAENKKKLAGALKFRGYNRGTITFDIDSVDLQEVEKILSNYGSNRMFDGSYSLWEKNFHEVTAKELKDLTLVNFDPIYKPFWTIRRLDKEYAVTWNPVTNMYGYYKPLEKGDDKLAQIPGYLQKDKYYTIPLSEGWRLYIIHPQVETHLCKWLNPDDQISIKQEFERRIRLKDIHTAEDSEVDQCFPNYPQFKLRPHQRVALEFSQLVDRKSIIAYGTGTGKTAIAIADAIRHNSERNLIVCPGALRLNWKNHIFNHTGEMPTILAGRAPTKEDFKYLLTQHPRWVIINYEILRSVVKDKNIAKGDILESDLRYPWVELLNLYHPTSIICDECHYAKNPSANQSKAVRRLGNEDTAKMALSGTPIMNRHGELWSMLNWLYPKQFPYYETFLRQYGAGRYIGVTETKQLRSLLETILIKRTRQDISKNLPPINRIVETFEMSPKARKIYDRALMGIYEEFAAFDHKGQGGEIKKYNSILPKINAMIKCCAADKTDTTISRAVEIADAIEEEEWNKVLIFTHFRGTCNTIARGLGDEALSFVRRTNKGFFTVEMEDRMELVKQFQNDPKIKFLVATEKSAREGLDITKAGVVMFNDLFWTPAAHIQCEGRAFYRESDMHGGDSMYLQLEDSIEEWITELQGVKSNTIEKVVEGKGIDFAITTQIVERLRAMFDKQFEGKIA